MITIIDHDKHFIIDPLTRKIMPETPEKNKLVQYDHNSERFTFEIPRLVEGHDMSLCDIIQIHFINVSSDKIFRQEGVEESHDSAVTEEDDKVLFSWLISRNATKYPGTLSFAIRFARTGDDGDVDYEWYTEIHTGISISSTINNGPYIVEEYADVLEEWRKKLFSTYETIIDINLPVNSWVEHSGDMTYYTQDISLEAVTEHTKIDLQPTSEQLISLIFSGISMFIANENGTVKVYSVSEKPTTDMIIQASRKEVIM